jgi:hypothetical protein
MKTLKFRCVVALSLLLALSIVSRNGKAATLTSNVTPPGYTITSLGSSSSFSTDADGNRVVVSSDGTRYAFPGSTTQQTTTQWTTNSLSQAGAPIPPGDYNLKDMNGGSLDPTGGISNASGTVVVGANYYANDRTHGDYASEFYTFTQKANGSFSPASVFYTQFMYSGGFDTISPILLNNNKALDGFQGGLRF